MRVVDEFRDPDVIAKTADEIRRLADPGRHYRLMEVCGGHTHAIYRFGLKDILPCNPDKHVMFFAIGFETTAPSSGFDDPTCQGRGNSQLLAVLQPRDDYSRNSRDSRFAGHASRRVYRPWPRVNGDRVSSL